MSKHEEIDWFEPSDQQKETLERIEYIYKTFNSLSHLFNLGVNLGKVGDSAKLIDDTTLNDGCDVELKSIDQESKEER